MDFQTSPEIHTILPQTIVFPTPFSAILWEVGGGGSGGGRIFRLFCISFSRKHTHRTGNKKFPQTTVNGRRLLTLTSYRERERGKEKQRKNLYSSVRKNWISKKRGIRVIRTRRRDNIIKLYAIETHTHTHANKQTNHTQNGTSTVWLNTQCAYKATCVYKHTFPSKYVCACFFNSCQCY